MKYANIWKGMTVPQMDCLDIISSSGEDHSTHIVPQDSEPVATFALGRFSEDHGMHYVSLTETYAQHIRERENDQDDGCGMSETNENFTDQQSGTGIREAEASQRQVKILERNENDTYLTRSSIGTSSEGFFGVIPDEIVDMIFKFITFGARISAMVNGYRSLFIVCRRSDELFYLPTRNSSSSYEKGYGPWIAQYFARL